MMVVFSERGWLRRFVFAGMLLLLGVMQGCAHTEEGISLSPRVKALMEEFPAGTIDSVEEADEVLDAVNYENKMLDYQFGVDMDACTQRFLVNNCYDEVQLRLRKDRAALRPLSVEADRFKRSNKVRLRDEALVDAEQEELGKAQQREASSRRYEEKEARYLEGQAASGADEQSAKRQASRVKYDEKQERYLDMKAADEASPPKVEDGAYTVGTPSKLKHPDTTLTPAQRAKNVQDYEDKQLEAEKKQESVQRRTAETQAKRDKRAADAGKEVKRKQKEAKD
ncbi:MAG: hypothetical protein GX776_07585 [Oxalobacter sp.]|nr:hypothetical protein [Oxalobacter sp.]